MDVDVVSNYINYEIFSERWRLKQIFSSILFAELIKRNYILNRHLIIFNKIFFFSNVNEIILIQSRLNWKINKYN